MYGFLYQGKTLNCQPCLCGRENDTSKKLIYFIVFLFLLFSRRRRRRSCFFTVTIFLNESFVLSDNFSCVLVPSIISFPFYGFHCIFFCLLWLFGPPFSYSVCSFIKFELKIKHNLRLFRKKSCYQRQCSKIHQDHSIILGLQVRRPFERS